MKIDAIRLNGESFGESFRPMMKRDERSQRLDKIFDRLEELDELDRRIIQPRAAPPVEITMDELFAYGERHEERRRLHGELRKLAAEPIE